MPKPPELTWQLIKNGQVVQIIKVPHGKAEPPEGWRCGVPPGISRRPPSKESK